MVKKKKNLYLIVPALLFVMRSQTGVAKHWLKSLINSTLMNNYIVNNVLHENNVKTAYLDWCRACYDASGCSLKFL